MIPAEARAAAQKHFDAEYYCKIYPDIPAAGVDPFQHYLDAGWREGRNPSSTFDTAYYIKFNPDVRASGQCPLVHYALHGQAEGRASAPLPDARRAAINAAVPPRERAKHWIRQGPIDPQRGLGLEYLLSGAKGVVVSVGHDDYKSIFGGIQNCIGDEAEEFASSRFLYVHLCPVQPLPMMAAPCDAGRFFVNVRANGELLGVASLEDLGEEIAHAARTKSRYLIIHHLLGHSPEAIVEFSAMIQPRETIYWIHDFFSLCPQFTLLRNDVTFCGAPPPGSAACRVCVYGAERRGHLSRIERLFAHLSPTVLAPSKSALDLFLERGRFLYSRAQVLPHGRFVFERETSVEHPKPSRVGQSRPYRIAFLGAAAFHKGWWTFVSLAERFGAASGFEFYHLGAQEDPQARNIRFVKVNVSPENRQAMADAVSLYEIDFAVNWSLCSETFCFTVHEAVAGGALVLANANAGNVWPAIASLTENWGRAFEDEQALFDWFATGGPSSATRPRRTASFRLSPATAAYLLPRVSHG